MLNTERLCLGCMNDNGGEKICPICGYDASSKNPDNCLAPKFFLKNRYLVGKMTETNGDGIKYIGWDNAENTIVTIKEYFPATFAKRNPDKTISMVQGGEFTFNEGLLEFKDINCNIMASSLPSLIPVTDVFEENGTVYAIETSVPSITLKSFLAKNGGILKWEQARALFLPLIDTIKGMNDIGVIHGGISTETIIVGRDGKLRLKDYSIKKFRSLGTELKPLIYTGFAAVEQYGFDGMHIDCYTDVYGICATIFNVLIGITPPEASSRIENDSMSIPSRFAEELPRHVLAALANGLQVLPNDRTKNIETFKNELVYGEIPNTPEKRETKSNHISSETKSKAKSGSSAKYAAISGLITVLVFVIIAAILIFGVFREDIFKPKQPPLSSEDIEVSAPTVDKIGDFDSDAQVTSRLYPVPDFSGKYYSEIYQNEEYEMFEITVVGKAFSDKFPKGSVCNQSIAAGGVGVVRDTKIELTISLGPKEIKIANLKGNDKETAILELLKQGFLYENIEVLEKYDEDRKPGTVIEQEPKYGELVSVDVGVKIYINSYTEDDDSSSQGNGNNSTTQ